MNKLLLLYVNQLLFLATLPQNYDGLKYSSKVSVQKPKIPIRNFFFVPVKLEQFLIALYNDSEKKMK